MITANVILDYSKWKNKIKNPKNYFKKKLQKLSKNPNFHRKKQEFSILLTNNKKMKSLNFKFKKKTYQPMFYLSLLKILFIIENISEI